MRTMEEDGLYCGYRYMKKYDYTAKLTFLDDGIETSSVALTNPELVMPEAGDDYLFYYKPYDIDGDGKEQEYIIARYGGCNHNRIDFIRPDNAGKMLEKIPIFDEEGQRLDYISTDPNPDMLKISSGHISVTSYANPMVTPEGWHTREYIFDPIKQALIRVNENR